MSNLSSRPSSCDALRPAAMRAAIGAPPACPKGPRETVAGVRNAQARVAAQQVNLRRRDSAATLGRVRDPLFSRGGGPQVGRELPNAFPC
jgi:hypothetical protein